MVPVRNLKIHSALQTARLQETIVARSKAQPLSWIWLPCTLFFSGPQLLTQVSTTAYAKHHCSCFHLHSAVTLVAIGAGKGEQKVQNPNFFCSNDDVILGFWNCQTSTNTLIEIVPFYLQLSQMVEESSGLTFLG